MSTKPKKKKKLKKRKVAAPPSPGTEDRISISEVQYLKFKVTKANEEVIRTKELKLAGDEQIISVCKENLELQKKITLMETSKVYGEVGIQAGDQVVEDKGQYTIIRRAGAQGPPVSSPMPPAPPAPPAPPIAAVVDDEPEEEEYEDDDEDEIEDEGGVEDEDDDDEDDDEE